MGTQGKTPQRFSSSYLGDKKFNISKTSAPGKRNSAGVGYLMLPADIDRELWIKTCYKKGQVSLLNENERIDNVLISKHIIKDLEFPLNYKKLGTKIVWVSTTKNVIAIAIINKASEVIEISNDQIFNVIKKGGKKSAIEISGNIEDEFLTINVDSKSGKSGKILLNITNINNKGELNILINGKTVLESNYLENNILENLTFNIQNPLEDSSTQTQIKYERTIGFTYSDEFGNKITINKDGTILGANSNQSMVLGDRLEQILVRILTELMNARVATMLGPQPLLNSVTFQQILNSLQDPRSTILSMKHKIEDI